MPNSLYDPLRQYLSERYPGATISALQFITCGWESEVYSFTLNKPNDAPQSYILRLYPANDTGSKLVRESRGLHLLRQAGYPVPGVLLYETDSAILGKPFNIIEKLEGEALWPFLSQAPTSQAHQLLHGFGALLAELHQLDWRLFTEDPARYEANPAILLDELLDFFRRLYTRFNLLGFLTLIDWLEFHKFEINVQPAINHRDFHANNVFLGKDDSLAVIDWTQITVSDYRVDLSWTLLMMGEFGQPEWSEWILEAYMQKVISPVADLDYFNVISYMKLLASTVICLRYGPEKVGLRPEAALSIPKQKPILFELEKRVQRITGLALSEVESELGRIG